MATRVCVLLNEQPVTPLLNPTMLFRICPRAAGQPQVRSAGEALAASHQARPMASICCWRAREGARRLFALLGQDREHGVDAREIGADIAIAAQESAEPEVIHDAQRREDLSAFGHMRHPPCDPAMGRRRLDPLAVERDPSGGDRLDAGQSAQERGLAGSV
jgi:hypothetical protein